MIPIYFITIKSDLLLTSVPMLSTQIVTVNNQCEMQPAYKDYFTDVQVRGQEFIDWIHMVKTIPISDDIMWIVMRLGNFDKAMFFIDDPFIYKLASILKAYYPQNQISYHQKMPLNGLSDTQYVFSSKFIECHNARLILIEDYHWNGEPLPSNVIDCILLN